MTFKKFSITALLLAVMLLGSCAVFVYDDPCDDHDHCEDDEDSITITIH